MQAKKKTVALIEPAAGNVDPATQRAVLAAYAKNNGFEIDLFVGDRSPQAGAAGAADHTNLINDISNGGVGLLLALLDVKHALPQEMFDACEEAGVVVKLVDVQQERGLSQTL